VYLFDLVNDETNPVYQNLSLDNLNRQYDFLQSVTVASLAIERPMLSLEVIRALNYHAIACLHISAGEIRPCAVTVGPHQPPPFYQVPALMTMFIDEVNRKFETADAVELAAFVLWRLNYIHPFINGNGRTARVTAYFVLCLKIGGLLPGDPTLPELIRAVRPEYVAALRAADASYQAGRLDLTQLHALLVRLLNEQVASAQEVADAAAAAADAAGEAAAAARPLDTEEA
jgi:hypothetical protein